jgi:organic radical activating enzyme
MQESNKNGQHATMEIVDKMIKFAQLAPQTTTISLSGGEPLTHPNFVEILDKVLEAFPNIPITIITNGELFIESTGKKLTKEQKKLKKEVLARLAINKQLLMQITTIAGIYPYHEKRIKKIHKAKEKYPFDNLGIVVCEDLPNGIIPVGRALKNQESINKVSFFAQRKSPSCFNMYNSLSEHNGNFFRAIDYVKTHSMTSFCKPMITETGLVKFGEYSCCSTIIDLNEISNENMEAMLDMTVDISEVLGPCKKCVNNSNMESVIDQYLYKFNEN